MTTNSTKEIKVLEGEKGKYVSNIVSKLEAKRDRYTKKLENTSPSKLNHKDQRVVDIYKTWVWAYNQVLNKFYQ